MNNNAVRWLAFVILLMFALSMIGFIAYARGPEHHRGDDVGSHGTTITTGVPPA